MTIILHRYTIDDFTDIEDGGFKYELPKETIDIINTLSDMVGAPSYNKTPIFIKKDRRSLKKKKLGGIDMQDADWEILRNFQATELEKKEGIEKKLDECRMLLNKITNDNYTRIKEKLILIISELLDDKEHMKKICNFIFDTASTNKFYSELYATLYSELMTEYIELKEIFESSFKEFIVLFDNIQSCNSNENYDLFCKINKINDKRRAMSLFIVNLMKKKIVKEDNVIEIINKLYNKLNEFINIENEQVSIEEITENLYILIVNSNNIHDNNVLTDIINGLQDISKYTIKDYKSLTHKTVFKIMDILDKIK